MVSSNQYVLLFVEIYVHQNWEIQLKENPIRIPLKTFNEWMIAFIVFLISVIFFVKVKRMLSLIRHYCHIERMVFFSFSASLGSSSEQTRDKKSLPIVFLVLVVMKLSSYEWYLMCNTRGVLRHDCLAC
jgi:hypothetical protein